jgi:adenylate cyclase
MRKTFLGTLIAVGITLSIARNFIVEPQPTRSLAVLPIIDLGSANDQGYFVDGLREEITNRLDRSGLGVSVTKAGPRFHDRNNGMLKVARSLRVDAVLQGSIRRTGNRVQASFSLFDRSQKSIAWSMNYDLESDSEFVLQDELATSVVPSLNAYLVHKASR